MKLWDQQAAQNLPSPCRRRPDELPAGHFERRDAAFLPHGPTRSRSSCPWRPLASLWTVRRARFCRSSRPICRIGGATAALDRQAGAPPQGARQRRPPQFRSSTPRRVEQRVRAETVDPQQRFLLMAVKARRYTGCRPGWAGTLVGQVPGVGDRSTPRRTFQADQPDHLARRFAQGFQRALLNNRWASSVVPAPKKMPLGDCSNNSFGETGKSRRALVPGGWRRTPGGSTPAPVRAGSSVGKRARRRPQRCCSQSSQAAAAAPAEPASKDRVSSPGFRIVLPDGFEY